MDPARVPRPLRHGGGTYIGVHIFHWTDRGLIPAEDPTWPGYAFNNWYTADNSTTLPGDEPQGQRIYPETRLCDFLISEEITDVILYA